MKVLFFMGHDGFIRNFEPVLRGLAERDHEVRIVLAGRRAAFGSDACSADELCAELPQVSHTSAAKGRDHAFVTFEDALITTRDYIRFHLPAYREATKLRARAGGFAPPLAARVADLPGVRSPTGVRLFDRLLRALERVVPVSPAVARQLAEERPDVALFTPLIGFRSRQVASVRAAKAAGIPTALLVHSWDNLTNKGVLHEIPDRVVVWNEAQQREAVELHGVPPGDVIVTGAQSYDHWFDWEPSTTREQLCAHAGLDPERPFVLYVCSSSFVAPDETGFVRRWLSALRAHSALCEADVLVRPHPQHLEQWRSAEIDEPGRTVLWPPMEAERSGPRSRTEYYDSIHHCAAVVGINTSALIEGAIQHRPVLSLLDPEFRDTQGGTLHFHHIAGDQDGFLLLGRTMDEHLAQLASAVSEGADPDRTRHFLVRFVRPHGLDAPATPRVLDAIEAVAALRPDPRREGARHVAARWTLRPLARLLRRGERRIIRRRRALEGMSR